MKQQSRGTTFLLLLGALCVHLRPFVTAQLSPLPGITGSIVATFKSTLTKICAQCSVPISNYLLHIYSSLSDFCLFHSAQTYPDGLRRDWYKWRADRLNLGVSTFGGPTVSRSGNINILFYQLTVDTDTMDLFDCTEFEIAIDTTF